MRARMPSFPCFQPRFVTGLRLQRLAVIAVFRRSLPKNVRAPPNLGAFEVVIRRQYRSGYLTRPLREEDVKPDLRRSAKFASA